MQAELGNGFLPDLTRVIKNCTGNQKRSSNMKVEMVIGIAITIIILIVVSVFSGKMAEQRILIK